jgi:hypothetical protein
VSGRILGVEQRPREGGGVNSFLSLLTGEGIRALDLGEISLFVFKDPALNQGLHRALDLLHSSRASETREFAVELPGAGTRRVSLSYVIPAPVWKVSYRLELSGAGALLQGWAIVDNHGDTDWEGLELSLVTGRPVSFIQDLYPPLMLSRPSLPLSIAGIAPAETYESSWGAATGGGQPVLAARPAQNQSMKAAEEVREERSRGYDDTAYEPPPPAPLSRGAVETASASGLGDQFEFTFKRPVSLARGQSAMLPLVEGAVQAEKALVFSGARLLGGGAVHPVIGAELVNTTGMKLPAGPLTVYDGGTYAGDALVDFFPAGEKRIVSWGEDLSVTGSSAAGSQRQVSSVSLNRGLMVINRKVYHERTYTVRNASGEEKRIILEHPLTRGTSLAEPASFEERTGELYRFKRTLPPGGELSLRVREESPVSERISLSQLRLESFVSYASNQEIPSPVREALGRAVELRQAADQAQTELQDLDSRRERLVSEQDRIRRNLEAAGGQTQQGQDYLRRMTAMDGELDALASARDEAVSKRRAAQAAYEAYLDSLNLEVEG